MQHEGSCPNPKRRTAIHPLVLLAVLALVAVACVPSPPPPSLPSATGVQWIRDLGGTINEDGDAYLGDYRRFSLLGGVTSGPSAAITDSVMPVTVANLGFLNSSASRPDGTAMQPWNGFAGEGINLVAPPIGEGEWVLQFPGGSCSLGFVDQFSNIAMVSPSPDGTKAVVRRNQDGPVHRVQIVSLVDGGTCPEITSVQYVADFPDSGAAAAGNVFVWAPDSSAVVYSLRRASDGMGIAQLAASSGATPVDVVAPTTGKVLPTGWSVADRILYSRTGIESGSFVSHIITRAVAGGPERVIDTATLPTEFPGFDSPLTIGGFQQFVHYGYFVPGTTSIVYQHGSSSVTDGDGYTFPRFFVALKADAGTGTSKPILGTKPPLTWHQEALMDTYPAELIDVPNLEYVERFIH